MNRWQFCKKICFVCVIIVASNSFLFNLRIFSADSTANDVNKLSPDIPSAQPKIDIPKATVPTGNGPETVSVSSDKIGYQGNWLKKKEWLVKSNEVYEEIYDLVASIQDVRKSFIEKFNSVDEQLDNFYKRIGLDQGKMQELFADIESYLEKKKKKELEAIASKQDKEEIISDRDVQVKIEQIEDDIKKNKTDLEQLSLDVKSVDDLDKSLTERLKKVDEQIAEVTKDIDRAKSIIDQVWDLIDDRKARSSYYELSGIVEKYKSISGYLKDELLPDFEKVSQLISSQIKKSDEGIKALEDKGVFLRDRAKKVEEARDIKKREHLALLQAQAEQKAKNQSVKKIVVEQPWYRNLYDYFVGRVASIYGFISSIYRDFFGKSSVIKAKTLPSPVKVS